MPKRFSADEVSIDPSAGTSTLSRECCGLNGMLGVYVVCAELVDEEEGTIESRETPFAVSPLGY